MLAGIVPSLLDGLHSLVVFLFELCLLLPERLADVPAVFTEGTRIVAIFTGIPYGTLVAAKILPALDTLLRPEVSSLRRAINAADITDDAGALTDFGDFFPHTRPLPWWPAPATPGRVFGLFSLSSQG